VGLNSQRAAWLYGYRTLILEIAHDVHPQIADYRTTYEEWSGSGSRGKGATNEAVELSTSSSEYRYSKHETVENRATMARLVGAIEQLRG
jgi:hypothetical protein